MRRLILGTMAAAMTVLGVSAGAMAASPVPPRHMNEAPHAQVQKVDYYWNHRHWQHRHWEHAHHHWRYYD